MTLATLALAGLVVPSAAASGPPASYTPVGNDCDDLLPDPCACGGANCSMVCTKLEAQTTQCSVVCLKDSSSCDAWGADLRCLITETGSETGFCAPYSMLWVLGVGLSLAGSLISNFGMQIQKVAFNRHEKDVASGATERKTPCCLPLWVAGFSGMVTGSILDFGSLVFAAQSLLAPLAASTLVINICQAPLIVGEKPTKLDIVCTLIIGAGCTLAVAFADHNTKTYSLQDMLELWINPLMIVWFATVLALMFVAWLIIHDGNQAADESRRGEKIHPRTNPSKIDASRATGSNWYPFIFAALGGQSGGNSILFAKSLGEVVKTVFQVGISFGDFCITLGMGVGLFCCMFVQLKYMNAGLRLFDVLFVLPIYQAFWISGATVNGILYFEEYNNFNDTQFVMFPIGCLLTVSGVAALALKFKQSATTEATPVEEGEDAPFTLEVADSVAQDTPDHSGGAMGSSSPQWQRTNDQLEKESPEVRARRLSDTNWRNVYMFAARAADLTVNFADRRLAEQHTQIRAYALKVAAAGGTERAAEAVAASYPAEQRAQLKQSLQDSSATLQRIQSEDRRPPGGSSRAPVIPARDMDSAPALLPVSP